MLKMNRRQILRTALKSGAGATVFMNLGQFRLFAGSESTYSARAVELVQRTNVIDMLAPLWISPSKTRTMLGNPDNFKAGDYAPYKESGISVFHIAIGTGGPDVYLETLKFLSATTLFWLAMTSGSNAWIRRRDWTGSKLPGKWESSWVCKTPNISGTWRMWTTSTGWDSECHS